MTTTSRLLKHYHLLTADERFALLVAAGHRRDELEAQRIKAVSPTTAYSVSDTYRFTTAAMFVALEFRTRQLEAVAWYLRAASIADQREDGTFDHALKLFGYLVGVHADGWREFCRRRGIEPNFFLADLPGGDLVSEAAEMVTDGQAYTFEEATAASVDKVAALLTPAIIADRLTAQYLELRRW